MNTNAPTIRVSEDPKFGPVVTCTDLEEADLWDDFLIEKDVTEYSTRFSDHQAEFYIPSASIDLVTKLVAEFYSRCIYPPARSDE